VKDVAVGRLMKRYWTGDVWVDVKLLHAEERMEMARARAARRALLRDGRRSRRGVRAWLGACLLAAGHRLLGSAASAAESAFERDPGSGPAPPLRNAQGSVNLR
jgi:hypothetical protein